MYNNNCFCNNNIWWIIILLLLFCGCGNNNYGTYDRNNGCGCDNHCC